jgi:hypothetical protein
MLCGSEPLQGKYSNSISAAAGFYPSSGYNDEIVWAAAWVAKATGAAADVTRAVSLYNTLGNRNKYSYFNVKSDLPIRSMCICSNWQKLG